MDAVRFPGGTGMRYLALGLALTAAGIAVYAACAASGWFANKVAGAVQPKVPRFAPAIPPVAALLSRVPPDADGVLVYRQIDGDRIVGSAIVALGGYRDTMFSLYRTIDGGSVCVPRGSGPRPILAVNDLLGDAG